jgi:hypothetical protein
MTWPQALARLWALPCSLVGSLPALVLLASGGSARWRQGAWEVTYRERLADCGRRAGRLPFRGIVFGHVILAVTAEELRHIGPHERVHVRQYERWGLIFFAAYPLCSLWQWLRGRRPYLDNPFEVEARVRGDGRGGMPSA